VCAAAALAVLDRLEAPGFVDDIAARGPPDARPQEAGRRYKDKIAEVRGLGLMVGVEIHGAAAPVLKGLRERGILATRPATRCCACCRRSSSKRGHPKRSDGARRGAEARARCA
jgi:acetylornithine/succinyldiaminopimelate/putrescine aminotransferase